MHVTSLHVTKSTGRRNYCRTHGSSELTDNVSNRVLPYVDEFCQASRLSEPVEYLEDTFNPFTLLHDDKIRYEAIT
jgi:hypothetical protein